MQIIDFLSSISTIVLVMLTGWYTYLTFKMLRSTNQPKIVVRLQSNEVHLECLINIIVENIGTGPAWDIKLKPNFPSTSELFNLPLENIGFVKHGIAYLGSGQTKESFLTSIIGKFEKQKENPVKVDVTFKDSTGRPHEGSFFLNFHEFDGTATAGLGNSAHYLQEISETLKGTKKSIDRKLSELSKQIYELGIVTIEKYDGENIQVHKPGLDAFEIVQFVPNKEKGWAVAHTVVVTRQDEVLTWKSTQITALKDRKSVETDYRNLKRVLNRGVGFISFYDETQANNVPNEIVQIKQEAIFTQIHAGGNPKTN